MPVKILKKRAEEDNLHMQKILLLLFQKNINSYRFDLQIQGAKIAFLQI